jgi:hypothetical protein
MCEIEPAINISELDLQALQDAANLETMSSADAPKTISFAAPARKEVNINDFVVRQPRSSSSSRHKTTNADILNIGPSKPYGTVENDGDWFGPFPDDTLGPLDRGVVDFSDFDDDDDVDDKLFSKNVNKSLKAMSKPDAEMESFLKSIEIGDDEDSDDSHIQMREKDSQPTPISDNIDELSTKVEEMIEKLNDIETTVDEHNQKLTEYFNGEFTPKPLKNLAIKLKRIEEKLDLVLSRLDSAFGCPEKPDETKP